MSITSVVVHFGGIWINETYQGGDKVLLVLSTDGITYQSFLHQMKSNFHGVDHSSVVYSVTCLVSSPIDDGGNVRLNVTNDVELNFALDNNVRKFYVTVTPTVSVFQNPQTKLSPLHVSPSSQNSGGDDGYNNSDPDDIDYEDDNNASSDSLDDDDRWDYDKDDDDDPIFHPLFKHHNVVPPIVNSSPLRSVYDLERLSNREYRKQWVIPGSMYQATLPVDEPVIDFKYSREPLSFGATFDSKESLMNAVGLYHLMNKCEYFVERSSPKTYYVVCKHKARCQFHMRSTTASEGSFWRITHWKVPHTCEIDLRVHKHRTICSKVVGAFFAPKLLDKGAVLRPKEMASQLQREFGFKINYSLAWAGRNHAIQMIYGDSDKSFQLLPGYLHMIEVSNPGSVVSLQTDEQNVFEYAFMALGASISGFLSSCRPVIVVDGTHLKGKYRGVLFVAASKDGNEHIFPLAVGIGDKENDRSWIWFLSEVKRAFGCPNDLLIVSDQHLSITNAVEVVYPGTHHGFCAFHIQRNLAKWGDTVVRIFQRAANCHRTDELQKYMRDLEEIAPNTAFSRLNQIDPVRWSKSYCPVRRYSHMTSNAAEIINGQLRWARTLPVCTLLECVRKMTCSWFVERRAKAVVRTHDLTERAILNLELSIEAGLKMVVEPVNASKFSIRSLGQIYIVDLHQNSCSCREFDLELIPCAHASAAICFAKQQHISYVSSYYTMKNMRATYAGDINPIPNKDEWILPEDVKNRIVNLPHNPRQAGRPRPKRIPSYPSSSNRVCSRCKQKGHYSSTCVVDVEMSSTASADGSKKRRKKACSICRQTDHNKKKCPSFAKHCV